MDVREQQLRSNILLCKNFIEIIKKCEGDPRQADALQHYEKQLEHLEECLKAHKSGKPEPIVIGLKPATLSAKAVTTGGSNG